MTLAADFANLFEGRHEAYGAVHGECVRNPVTGAVWEAHLNGERSLGVYPLIPFTALETADRLDAAHLMDVHDFTSTLWCRWGCTDIDIHQGQDASRPETDVMRETDLLMQAAETLGLTVWQEVTKSRGRHLWLFTDTVVPAEVMRRAFLAVHQLAGVPPTEVNPKQTSVEHLKAGFGNYVNLPYFGFPAFRRNIVHDVGFGPHDMDPQDFVREATASRHSFEELLEVARLYVEPPPKQIVNIGEYDGALEPLVKRLSGLAFTIFTNGPLPERPDRSVTLAKLAHKIRESGLDATQCLALMTDADRRWGKFYDRSDGMEQLQRLVTNAYER